MEYEEEVVGKKEIISCCQSYRTAMGRCYDCPEDEFNDELDS